MPSEDLYLNARKYYATWAGIDPEQLEEPGVTLTVSAIRDEKPAGYNRPVLLYCLVRPESVHICVGKELARQYGLVLRNIQDELRGLSANKSLDMVIDAMQNHGVPARSSAYKYYLRSTEQAKYSARVQRLTSIHYPQYLSLFRAVWPDVNPADWLEEYYESRLANLGYAWGIFEKDKIVSATDAGSIPYLPDLIIEPGIKTHPAYRRRGFARLVCSSQLRHVLDLGLTPVWSCGSTNMASARLASSLGFSEFGKTIEIDINRSP